MCDAVAAHTKKKIKKYQLETGHILTPKELPDVINQLNNHSGNISYSYILFTYIL